MPDETERTDPPSNAAPPDLQTAIGRLMAHPEILEMAASVLGQEATATPSDATGSQVQEEAPDAQGPTEGAPAASLPDLMRLAGPLLSGKSSKHGDSRGLDRCSALLIALKPYLSESRCRTVDRLVEVGRLGELLDKLR